MNPQTYDLSLRVKHPTTDLQEVCEKLGLELRRIWKAGDRAETPNGKTLQFYRRESYCSLKFENESGPLHHRLASALALLDQKKDILLNIISNGGTLTLCIGWFTEGDNGADLDINLIKKLSELNIALALFIYCQEENGSIPGG
jgi:hypothetical protein